MSVKYKFFNEHPPKSLFKIKNKLDYNKWCEVMESYNNMTWDIHTKHGNFYYEKYGHTKFKTTANFDYLENPEEFEYIPGEAITTGTYSFFIVFDKEIGYAWAQFYKNEKKKLVPLFYEISQKLGCYLYRERELITHEDIDNLNKAL